MDGGAFGRRDVLIATVILTLPGLAGTARDLLPEVIVNAVRFGLLPVTVLVHELQTSVIWGGVDGFKEVLFRTFHVGGNVPFVLDVSIIIVVSYLVAFVSVHVGETLVQLVDEMPDDPRLNPVIGTIVTVGILSLVGNTTKLLTADPVQRQIFHPQAVSGAITLAILVVVLDRRKNVA